MKIVDEGDTILIQSIINGNKNAEKELYDKYHIIIKKFIKYKYPKNSDIDDDVSEIMIKIFNKLDTFDVNKSKFKSWVLVIANNHMIDKWRCQSNTFNTNNHHISFENSNDDDDKSNENYLANTMFNNDAYSVCSDNFDFENDSTINFISKQISSVDFTLLNMKYVQGYNYDEIGKEFNVTSTTISNRVNYIKSKLKFKYKELFEA